MKTSSLASAALARRPMSRLCRAAIASILTAVCPDEHPEGPENCARCFSAADAIALPYAPALREWGYALMLAPGRHSRTEHARLVNAPFNVWIQVHGCACGVDYGHILDLTEEQIAHAHDAHRTEALAAAEALPLDYAVAITGYVTDVLSHTGDDIAVSVRELLNRTRHAITRLLTQP